jgi:hypothetical protein
MNVYVAYPAADPIALKDALCISIFGTPDAVELSDHLFGSFGSATRKVANSGRDLKVDFWVHSPKAADDTSWGSRITWVKIGVTVTAAPESADHSDALEFLHATAARTGGFVQSTTGHEGDYLWEVPEEIIPLEGLDQQMAEWMHRFGPYHAEAYAAVVAKGWDIVPKE